jgi:acetyl esterase/lipase
MAQAPMSVVPLYPESYPKEIPPERQEKDIDGGRCINNVHYPTLTISLPEPAKATGASVVICPGGGYGVLAVNHEGRDIAKWLNSFGVAAFMLKYRLPPEHRHPAPMEDVQRAIRMVRFNAEQWGVKANRIGVMGFSAGGHLASTAATHFDGGKAGAADPVERVSCRPDFAILAYPVVCFSRDYCHSGSRANLLGEPQRADLVQLLSNELQVTAATPPTFLFHSTDDGAVDVRNTLDFYLACKMKGVSAEVHVFPKGGHGYGMGSPGSQESQWPGLCQRWLQALGMLSV